MLIERGANVCAVNNEKETALHKAAFHPIPEELFALMVQNGSDINARNFADETALHIAAAWGRLEAVRVLIASGADRSAKDGKGRTPLERAAENNFSEIVLALQAAR